MEQLYFNKDILLENFQIFEDGRIKLINDFIKIIITLNTDDKHLELYGFYKQKKIKGIARCSLYFLLQKLIIDKKISEEYTINVNSPTPDNGNLERLIRLYQEIGFRFGVPQPGRPTNLIAKVSDLIQNLKLQCNHIIDSDNYFK